MKQLLQHIRSGEAVVADVPAPRARAGMVLVQTAASLVSAGTERMVVDFAAKNLVQKARSRPDLVRQTVDKARREGILTTLEAVQNKLDQPMALGYSCAGTVIEVGPGVEQFKPGDYVACAGGGYATHAEIVRVPQNLVVPLAKGVAFDEAAFTTVGAIALQGIRLADPKLGEVVAVIGLGLLGQLTVQMLVANGCRVVGMDLQAQRADLARQLGAEITTTASDELQDACAQLTSGHGVDAVLITADTTSNQPVELAGVIARDKGVVVAVGAVGMTIPRKSYYEKEIDFRISRSYGPGRYDPTYEEQGLDYPYAYVRWTEQRNMQAFADLLAAGRLRVAPLITHRFPIEEAPAAYDLIASKTDSPSLGVILTYSASPDPSRTVRIVPASQAPTVTAANPALGRIGLGVVGAGNFANATLLPSLKGIEGLDLVGVAAGSGVSARTSADRFGFTYCTTDPNELLLDPAITTVAILTRHNLHARQVIDALVAGKHVFVEKPLCLTETELEAITTAHQAAVQRAANTGRPAPALMVGFNRRFAPFVRELRRQLRKVHEPVLLNYRVNAGYIPPEHWTHDPAQGGGRLLGEGCHFIDLLIDLAGSLLQRITTRALPDASRYNQDNLLVTLEFANGSIGTISYVANGDKSFGKECLEVFGGGLSARIDDYRSLTIRHGDTRIDRVARLRQDKGHRAECEAFVAHLRGKQTLPISFEALTTSTRATLAAAESLHSGAPVELR